MPGASGTANRPSSLVDAMAVWLLAGVEEWQWVKGTFT